MQIGEVVEVGDREPPAVVIPVRESEPVLVPERKEVDA